MKNTCLFIIAFVLFNINVNAQLKFSVTTSIKTPSSCGGLCDGEVTATASNGTPPYSYYWVGPSGTSTSNPFINACPGNYSVTATDASGSTATNTAVLTEDIFTGANWPINFFNTLGDEVIYDVATDNLGNVYAIGTFTGDITFNQNISFTNNNLCGNAGIFVVKFNYCGEVENAKYYGNTNEPNLHLEWIANTNQIAIAGQFCGNIDFTATNNPMTAVDNFDCFFAILDPSTLYCNANQQVHFYSNSNDIVNGISVNGSAVYVAGGFQGSQFQFSNSSTILTNPTSGWYEMFLCQFNCSSTNVSLYWANNYHLWASSWHDIGMTMQFLSGYIYFTYNHTNSSQVRICNLGRVSAFGGSGLATQQIGSGSQFFNVNDMVAGSNGYLYLCGYYQTSYSAPSKRAAIFYYPSPNTNMVLNTNDFRYANTSSVNNEATKLVINGSNVFVSGTYDYSGFQIGSPNSGWFPQITLYGTTNHFVFKTDAMLIPANGWLSGVASTTTNISKGNTLAYDGTNNVYYLGGTFNGNLKFTGALGQTISPYASYDGFIARFQDNGVADFKMLEFNNLENKQESKLSVYPNPTQGSTVISILQNEVIKNITVTDLTGRVVYNNDFEGINNTIESNLSLLNVGTYFISVKSDLNNYNQKIVIIK